MGLCPKMHWSTCIRRTGPGAERSEGLAASWSPLLGRPSHLASVSVLGEANRYELARDRAQHCAHRRRVESRERRDLARSTLGMTSVRTAPKFIVHTWASEPRFLSDSPVTALGGVRRHGPASSPCPGRAPEAVVPTSMWSAFELCPCEASAPHGRSSAASLTSSWPTCARSSGAVVTGSYSCPVGLDLLKAGAAASGSTISGN